MDSIDLVEEQCWHSYLNNPVMSAFSAMMQLPWKVIELENWTEETGPHCSFVGKILSPGFDLNAVESWELEDGMAVCRPWQTP